MITNICMLIIRILATLTIQYVGAHVVTKIIIKNKSLNLKNIDEVINIEHYDIKNNNNENISNNMPLEYKEKIYKFRKKVINVTKDKNINLSNMNRNLEKLCIIEKKKMRNDSVTGTYSSSQNKICVKKRHIDSFFHEFMHMCSSYQVNNLDLCGFHIIKGFKEIGRAINEGYTSLLTTKFTKSISSYFFEFRIAFIIEQIIGEDKMMKYYFESDLFNLKKELLNYSDEITINKIFKYMDIILEYKDLSDSKKNKYLNFIGVLAQKVNKYIDEIVINRLNYLPDTEKINLLKIIKQYDYLNFIDENLNVFDNNKTIINQNTNIRLKIIFDELYNKAEKENLEKKASLLKIKSLNK